MTIAFGLVNSWVMIRPMVWAFFEGVITGTEFRARGRSSVWLRKFSVEFNLKASLGKTMPMESCWKEFTHCFLSCSQLACSVCDWAQFLWTTLNTFFAVEWKIKSTTRHISSRGGGVLLKCEMQLTNLMRCKGRLEWPHFHLAVVQDLNDQLRNRDWLTVNLIAFTNNVLSVQNWTWHNQNRIKQKCVQFLKM